MISRQAMNYEKSSNLASPPLHIILLLPPSYFLLLIPSSLEDRLDIQPLPRGALSQTLSLSISLLSLPFPFPLASFSFVTTIVLTYLPRILDQMLCLYSVFLFLFPFLFLFKFKFNFDSVLLRNQRD